MKSWKVEAAIIAVGLLLLGIMVKGGINNFVNKDRVVSVKGLAEMEVPADKVVWPLVYKDIGNDPALLYANMEKKNAAVVSFLENNGIEKEEISIAPPEVIDMQAERYVDRNVAYRYNATSVITVTSKNVDRVRKLMSGQAELLKQGIAITGGDYKYNVSYEFTGLNEVKPRMIEEATKNARAAAEKFAKDSDSELGKIRNASQGQFSISDRDAYLYKKRTCSDYCELLFEEITNSSASFQAGNFSLNSCREERLREAVAIASSLSGTVASTSPFGE